MVNVEWYGTFKGVYKTGTITRAAKILFISQPGVSLRLSSLENYVDYKFLAFVPYFLCKKEIDNQQIQLIWKGKVPLENTLYLSHAKKTIYIDEINLIKKIFLEVM